MNLVLFWKKLPTKAYHILCDFFYHINHIIRNCIVKIVKYLIVKMKFIDFLFGNTCKLEHHVYNSIMGPRIRGTQVKSSAWMK